MAKKCVKKIDLIRNATSHSEWGQIVDVYDSAWENNFVSSDLLYVLLMLVKLI